MISSYYDGSDILTADHGSADYARISPSSISKFFASPRSWWGENFLGEPGFQGSTATALGTIVHHFSEQAAKKQQSNSEQDVADYLASCKFDLDASEIKSLWRDMSQTMIDNCIVGKTFHSVEQFIHHKVLPGVYVAGTYDALLPAGNGTFILRDYKTASTKPSGITYSYRMQLHTYAWILKQQGIDVSYIELQYVTQPTKTLPVRHFEFREPITQEDLDKIGSQILTIAKSIQLWKSNPELRWALAQDNRLALPEKPALFKD